MRFGHGGIGDNACVADSFGFVGAESTLYFSEELELDKIPEPKQKQEIS